MEPQNTTSNLIEHILSLLSLSEQEPFTACFLSEGEDPGGTPGKAQEMVTILEVIRFLDEMPGGFFIYRAQGDGRVRKSAALRRAPRGEWGRSIFPVRLGGEGNKAAWQI